MNLGLFICLFVGWFCLLFLASSQLMPKQLFDNHWFKSSYQRGYFLCYKTSTDTSSLQAELGIQGQPELHRKPLFQKIKKNNKLVCYLSFFSS